MDAGDITNKNRVSKLEFESLSLKKDFYAYIKTYKFTNFKDAGNTTILSFIRSL